MTDQIDIHGGDVMTSDPTPLRVRLLMRVHGLTEAQAMALAALVWGMAI